MFGIETCEFSLNATNVNTYVSIFPLFNATQARVKVEASWDSTVHDCPQLSRVSAEQRVYLTVKTVVQLSHPAQMQLVLRKRICVSITGKQVVGPESWLLACFLFLTIPCALMDAPDCVAGFCTEPAEEDVSAQQHPRHWSHL